MTEALRRKLTNAGRVLAMEDQGDIVAGHVTVRLPDDKSRFLMKPATIGLDEMTPRTSSPSISTASGSAAPCRATTRCTSIRRSCARAPTSMRSSIPTRSTRSRSPRSARSCVPVNNDAGYFYKKLPVFSETSDLIVTPERGKAVARCLGKHNAVLLRNHGIVAAGRTLEEAVWIALKLERACKVQLMAEWAGGPKFVCRGRGPREEEPARHAAGPLHQRVQLPRALLVPGRTARPTIPAARSTTRRI